MAEDDLLTFIDDADDGGAAADGRRTWKVAVIDDDPAVHSGTRFALWDYQLNGDGIELLSAFSAAEGRRLLEEMPDVAVVLLDVVMERDDAGLELVEYIRKTLGNEAVRIILRTGQPGQAPERKVIVDYDINDYKAKTELTADRLFTTLTAALRSYQQIRRMMDTRRGLVSILEASATFLGLTSSRRLAANALGQLPGVLGGQVAGLIAARDAGREGLDVLARLNEAGEPGAAAREADLLAMAGEALATQRHRIDGRRASLVARSAHGHAVAIALEVESRIGETEKALLELYAERLGVAFDNMRLYEELQQVNASLETRVTERTRALMAANRRLAGQWRSLRRANAFKSEILGKVAHDLKNPLGVILGRTEIVSELLQQDEVPSDGIATQVEHVRLSARRLTEMVDTLIADAMSDALDITIRPESLDAAALAAEVVETNLPLAERKGQAIATRLDQGMRLIADPERLREAIDNLVSNAIKYSPFGAAIRVGVGLAEDGRVRIFVEDEGPGLLPEDLGRVFGRFQRLSAKPTGGESSTGLGLSIAKRIVDLHGGDIKVSPGARGVGSIFAILLPAEWDDDEDEAGIA